MCFHSVPQVALVGHTMNRYHTCDASSLDLPCGLLDPEHMHAILPLLGFLDSTLYICVSCRGFSTWPGCQPLSHVKCLSFILQMHPGTHSLPLNRNVKNRNQPCLILFILIHTTTVDRYPAIESLA